MFLLAIYGYDWNRQRSLWKSTFVRNCQSSIGLLSTSLICKAVNRDVSCSFHAFITPPRSFKHIIQSIKSYRRTVFARSLQYINRLCKYEPVLEAVQCLPMTSSRRAHTHATSDPSSITLRHLHLFIDFLLVLFSHFLQ